MFKKLFILLFFLLNSTLVFSQKDSIRLADGQILIGKIKSLEKSILVFSTSFSDSDFKIKWWRVREVYSKRTFILVLNNGKRFSSTINTDSINKKNVVLLNINSSITTNISNVISLDPFGSNFLSRLELSFDAGITLTKANNLSQITGNAAINYTAFKWSFLSDYNMVFSKQDDTEDISRYEANTQFLYFLKNEWFLKFGVNLLSNSDQKLKLRTTGTAGAGYFFKKNNRLYFNIGAGLAFNNESYTDNSSPGKNSLESYFATEFNKYDIGDLSLLTAAAILPSLTEGGRIRVNFKFDLKYDITSKLYLKAGITYNYDNEPVPGATSSDYIFQTTFGWDNN